MLEHKISQLYKEMTDNEEKHNKELDKLKTEFDKTGHQLIPQKNCDKEQKDVTDNSVSIIQSNKNLLLNCLLLE